MHFTVVSPAKILGAFALCCFMCCNMGAHGQEEPTKPPKIPTAPFEEMPGVEYVRRTDGRIECSVSKVPVTEELAKAVLTHPEVARLSISNSEVAVAALLSLYQLAEIEQLSVRNCTLTDVNGFGIPPALGPARLKKLRVLDLRGSDFTIPGIGFLSHAEARMESLEIIAFPKIVGVSDVEELITLPQLKEVDFSSCEILMEGCLSKLTKSGSLATLRTPRVVHSDELSACARIRSLRSLDLAASRNVKATTIESFDQSMVTSLILPTREICDDQSAEYIRAITNAALRIPRLDKLHVSGWTVPDEFVQAARQRTPRVSIVKSDELGPALHVFPADAELRDYFEMMLRDGDDPVHSLKGASNVSENGKEYLRALLQSETVFILCDSVEKLTNGNWVVIEEPKLRPDIIRVAKEFRSASRASLAVADAGHILPILRDRLENKSSLAVGWRMSGRRGGGVEQTLELLASEIRAIEEMNTSPNPPKQPVNDTTTAPTPSADGR